MNRSEASSNASAPAPLQPARTSGAGRSRAILRHGSAALALPALWLPALAFGAPGPAPDPLPAVPQTASPPSLPPLPFAGHKATPGQAVANAYPALSADDELILEIRTEHREMTDTITGHGLRGGVYLPLGDLARFLDLAIAVSDDGHYANGWFLSPGRTVSINLRAGTITLAGKEAPLPKADFASYDGELWVKAERLAAILPIELKTDLRAASVVVKTTERFPFETKLEREAARERLANSGHHAAPAAYDRLDTPYRLFDVPISEAELRTAAASGTRPRAEIDVRTAGDFLFMTARAFVSVSSAGGLSAARLELGRRDPDAGLLGPIRATEFQLGDVASSSLPLGLRGIAGRGFALTNEPLERASVFEALDFRGALQAGFEVELYRNGTLVGSTRDAVNGQYEFAKVPVEFGLNVFRLVFYGPQGQRREEVRQISVGDGRLAKGQFTYNVFAVQKDVSLSGIKPQGQQPSIDQGDWREGVTLQYGLSGALTVVGSGALYQTGGTARWLAQAGLRTGLGGWAARADVALGGGGGTNGARAIELGLAGKLLGTSVVLSHADYANGFIDEVRSPSDLPLKSMTQFDLARTLHLGLRTMPLSLGWQHLVYANGQVTDTAIFRQTFTLGRVMASNVVDYTDTATPGTHTSHTLTGTFDLSTFAGSHTQYRAEAGYSLGPHAALTSIGGEMSREINAKTTVRASLTHSFANRQTAFGVSGTRKLGPLALSLDGTYTMPTRSYALTLRLGLSFGRNPLSGKMFVARPGLSSSGAVAVRAFSDDNGNGTRDPGEAALGGVEFFTASQHVTADKAGEALLTGIGDGAHAAVRIDGASLPDIAMAPAHDGYRLVPRAGRIPVVEFAVQRLSDIEGNAVFADGARRRAVSGLKLVLVDAQGRRVAKARSESDGFVLLEQVRPGDYTLALDPVQAASLKIRLASEAQVHVGHNGKLVRLKVVVVPQ